MPLDKIIALLRQKIGLDAGSIGSAAIESAVRQRMAARAIAAISEYAPLALSDAAEQKALIEKVVVSETCFFREAAAFELLAKQARAKSRLALLSLPCATGEEPYSMVMTLLQAGLPASAFHIDAIDVSRQALELAQTGIYSRHSFRGSEPKDHDRFFKRLEDGRYEFAHELRSQVRFAEGNILEPPAWLASTRYDVIFCRNLLIYLDAENRRKAIAFLRRLLKPGGLIFAGHAEIQEMRQSGLELCDENRAFAFRVPEPKQPDPPKPQDKPPDSQNVPEPPDVGEIARLANRGAYSEAAALCDRFLRASPGSAEGYFWQGVIRHAQSQSRPAEESFRKAIYLDPAHYQSLVHLALLLEHQGDNETANRLRQRAERVAPVLS